MEYRWTSARKGDGNHWFTQRAAAAPPREQKAKQKSLGIMKLNKEKETMLLKEIYSEERRKPASTALRRIYT
jgi:hypothetical protein